MLPAAGGRRAGGAHLLLLHVSLQPLHQLRFPALVGLTTLLQLLFQLGHLEFLNPLYGRHIVLPIADPAIRE